MARLIEGSEMLDIEGELIYPTRDSGLKHDYLAIFLKGKRICEGTSSGNQARVARNFVLYCFGSKKEELIGQFRIKRVGEGVGYGRFKGGYVMAVWPRREMIVHHSSFRSLWHQYGGYPIDVSSLEGFIDRPTNWPSFISQWTQHSRSIFTAPTGETLQIGGGTYIGEVVNGRPHGQGTWTHPDGRKYVGESKDGKQWEGIQYLASGEVEKTYSNGKKCSGCTPTAKQLAIVREIDPSQIAPTPTPEQASTTVASTKTTQKPGPAQAKDSSLELEFWKSIKESGDPDMYREYLRQFPSGVYAGLAKIKIKKLGGDTTVANASIPNLDYGDYYALVIGNNDYQDLTNLRSAVNDAKVVSTVLEVDYGFNVKLLENASRKEILRSLKHLRQSVSAKDNVLIYYAGHGYLDEAADQGYWLPIDSERDDDSNWIATDRVAGQIKAMKAKHVMVVADSCFSGTITRAIKIEQRTPEWLSQIVKKKARTALTSGGLEPVLDTGSGNHSAFAYAFISLLEENDGVLDGAQLFTKLRPKVMVNSTQTPQYGKIHMAGDDGGDFLFVRQ
ncbi:MAG: caspase family protein [Arenicellales bacterium]|jgi:hypothetical protein|nr:caspase family protein [Arenicellales bacterium]